MAARDKRFPAETGICLAALALSAVVLLLTAPPASADLSFCPIGEAAGQCGAPPPFSQGGGRGLAVDSEEDLLYVADESNNRVDVFEVDEAGEAMKFLFAFGYGVADGTTNAPQTCSATCFKGIAGAGAGQFNGPTAVAVDNDPASSSQHAIYVTDSQNLRVEKFEPNGDFVWTVGGFDSSPFIATGPGGVVYAVDGVFLAGNNRRQRLQRFEPSGAPIGLEIILLEGDSDVLPRAIAVDAAGDLWVAGQGVGLSKRCAPTWASCAGPFETAGGFARGSLTIATGGGLFVGLVEKRDKGFDSFKVITALDATGAVTRRFGYATSGGENPINGLATHSSALGELFASKAAEGITYLSPPPPGPVPAAPSLEVNELGSARAMLFAEVNPEGKASEVHFEYLTQAEWEAQGESFAGSATKATPTVPLGASGFNLKLAEALIGCPDPAAEAGQSGSKCLSPQTTYRWRVAAENADGKGPGPLEGAPLTTKPAPEFGQLWATAVGADTARLHGELNPTGIPTTGFFEYVDEASFQQSGFAEALKAPAEAPLDFGSGEGMQARSVAIYPLDPGTAYRYRLVADSPLLAEPVASEAEQLRTFAVPLGDGSCPNAASRLGASAFLPDCRAYELVSPIDKEGGDIRVLHSALAEPAVLEQSSLSGEKLAYGSVRSFGGAASAPYTSQYIAQRIAGEEWETHPINPPRGAPTVPVITQREDSEFKAFSPDLCETWFTSFAEPPLAPGALPKTSNLYRRTDELCPEAGAPRYEALGPNGVLAGLTPDGQHAAFTTGRELLPEGTAGQSQLYEQVRGVGLRFVCILPEGGGPVSGSCTAGSAAAAAIPGAQIGRVSADGERIFWSAPGAGEGKIYVRIDPESASEGDEQTIAVSKEGEEESGTAKSWFWGASADGSTAIFSTTDTEAGISDLYEFDVDGEETTLIAGGVIGVLGIGADAKRVYFASSKVLSGEEANANGDKAQAGKANLYLRDADGSTEFIGTLGTAGQADHDPTVSKESYRDRSSLVTPSGGDAIFESIAPLTGYDNTRDDGAVCGSSGALCPEIFRYDAEAHQLSCVSCNPSGARPRGGARIPFWQTPAYAARVISEDGSRLYFQSADALAPRDTNGAVDVYQWQAPGTGGCAESSPSYSPQNDGCVDLISSGQSPQDSRFVEADPSGENVFVATASGLLPQDPGGFDIYDARVGGGLPIPQPPPPSCEGEACQSPPAPPENPNLATAAHHGSGNVVEPATKPCPKGKVRRHGKCVKRHRKAKHKRSHHRRASTNRRAHR